VSHEIRLALSSESVVVLACLSAAFSAYRRDYTPAAYEDTVPAIGDFEERFREMTVFVADEHGAVVGTVGCTIQQSEGHLRGMAVLPSAEGSGVGARLLGTAERYLARRGCSRVTLDTTQVLQRAIRFYERNGYAATGRVTDFYGMPLYEYAKNLPNR
jgi:GNAT superfamily N-acetyltransferase